MKIKRCNNIGELLKFVDSWCETKVRALNASSMYLPAGNTVVPLYKKWETDAPEFLKSLVLHQVDDIIEGERSGLFKDYFQTHLPSYQTQIKYIEKGQSSPLFCDLAILGLGLNGHVAFHEPSMPVEFEFGDVTLTPTTCSSLNIESGTLGISYGVQAFLKCQQILLIVTGKSKKEILTRVLAQDKSLPASHLLGHKHCQIVTDLPEE